MRWRTCLHIKRSVGQQAWLLLQQLLQAGQEGSRQAARLRDGCLSRPVKAGPQQQMGTSPALLSTAPIAHTAAALTCTAGTSPAATATHSCCTAFCCVDCVSQMACKAPR